MYGADEGLIQNWAVELFKRRRNFRRLRSDDNAVRVQEIILRRPLSQEL